jgi:hypothetical protein
MNNYISSYRPLILGIIAGLALLGSCRGDRSPMLPNVTGRAGEVVVVVNSPVWESEAGRALGRILDSEHPALPQREPLFDIVRIRHAAFSNIFKTHRNIVVVNVSDNYTDNRMNVRRNVWARPQILLEINAKDNDALLGFVTSQEERILEELLSAEKGRIKEYNRQYEKRSIRDRLNENLDLSLVFPPGYSVVLDTTDFVWINFNPPAQEMIQGVFIYHYDYTDQATFTADFLVNKRNQFLRRYVPGPTQGSWMSTEMQAYPIFSQYMDDDRYFAKLEGLWKVENDFMGGPFVSLTTLDEERNRVVTVEGFVYAPNQKKRNLLRQVEAIIQTLEISQ